VMTVGIIAFKLLLFVVVPVWLAWKLASWAFRWRGGGERRTPDTPRSAEAS
jgi:hypothetical protein